LSLSKFFPSEYTYPTFVSIVQSTFETFPHHRYCWLGSFFRHVDVRKTFSFVVLSILRTGEKKITGRLRDVIFSSKTGAQISEIRVSGRVVTNRYVESSRKIRRIEIRYPFGDPRQRLGGG